MVKKGIVTTGFSRRIPDYATQYWLDRFEKTAKSVSSKKFLDIGAGSGRLSLLLASSGFEKGVAVEIDVDQSVWEKNLNVCKNLSLKEGLLQELLPALQAEGPFDLIVLAEVFEHIPLGDVDNFLSTLKKILAVDGRIFLTTPNFVVQGAADQSAIWHERQPWGHHKHYSFVEIKTLLESHGFSVEGHTFECNKKKTTWYNKWYYPVVRVDEKLMYSKKLPLLIRTLYRVGSMPAIVLGRGVFWTLANFIRSYEEKNNSEQTAGTMIMTIKHAENY